MNKNTFFLQNLLNNWRFSADILIVGMWKKSQKGTEMKIIPENMLNSNRNITKKHDSDNKKPAAGAISKSSDYDKVTIGADKKTGLSDAQFVAQLKKGILAEIQAGAPEYKLDDLKQQIALDEYDVNVPDIARKILLDNEVGHE